MAVQDYVLAHASGLQEIEINPLICTQHDAIAADALLRRDLDPN
jgi:succinyl-CoA synthetase beta subunit